MRIIKYIFLLLVLVFIAVSVFVATEKGEFDITKTILVKSPRAVVFNYVNDYSNWQPWFAYGGSGTEYAYTNITAGKGASLSWDGSESGMMQTVAIKENDSIYQKMEVDGMPAEGFWIFKDTTGGTKVTWRVKGKMGFMPKIYATLKGGADRVIGTVYEKSLTALDKNFNHEINTYKVTVDGITDVPGKFYLRQTITSTIANMPRNMRIMTTKLAYYFRKNKIQTAGKPFVLYDYFDKSKGITKFSVCIPVAEEVFISPGSDISSGKFASFHAVKTTLTGDYSHLAEAWDKTFGYIEKNGLKESETGSYVEAYKVSKEDVKSPSKWVTEIYIPINAIAAAPVTPVQTAQAVSAPAQERPKPETPTEEISIP